LASFYLDCFCNAKLRFTNCRRGLVKDFGGSAMTEQIAFYGKGGVGKSTLISNLSAAIVEAGFRVMQIGCDPKGDSCSILNGGVPVPTVADQYSKDGVISFDSVVHRGFKGIYCVELGSTHEPGAQNIDETVTTLGLLNSHSIISSIAADFVLYDISGENACGALHATLQKNGLNLSLIITTADFMSLCSANSILTVLDRLGQSSVPVPFGGIVPNGISSSFEESFIYDFAKHTRIHSLGRVPRSLLVRQCELYGKTVIEASPLSNQSYFYRRLANQIVEESKSQKIKSQPCPMPVDALRIWAREWADQLYALENGLVTDGAAI
jgi:nitrogenase iron protein NifH